MARIHDVGCVAVDDGGAEQARLVAADLDVELVADHVEDLVDHQADMLVAVAQYQHRLVLAARSDFRIERHERHQAATILCDQPAAGRLDPGARHHLEPGDQRQWQRLLGAGSGTDQQQVAATVALGSGVVRGPPTGLGGRTQAAGAGDAERIEDHDDRSVAQDGVAAEQRDAAYDRRHRLDHDLLGVEDMLDDQAQALAAHGEHHHHFLG